MRINFHNLLRSIGYHLIVCVKSLQNVLNSQDTSESVHFNTYILSILVIFFLQKSFNFPKLKDLPSTQLTSIDNNVPIDKDTLKKAIKGFFKLYEKYEVGKHLIDLNIGRWQERQLQSSQTIFSPEQKRFAFISHVIRSSVNSNRLLQLTRRHRSKSSELGRLCNVRPRYEITWIKCNG